MSKWRCCPFQNQRSLVSHTPAQPQQQRHLPSSSRWIAKITRLHAQIASLEQLLAVHEQAVLEQAERNAQLYAQSAVLAERHRLARDLHVSVTQSIYSTLLFADAGRLALQAEQTTVAAENLREARQMAGNRSAEMRLLLYELHPPELVEEGLASACSRPRLEAVESRTGLQVKFTVAGTIDLSPEQEGQLYKIVPGSTQ